MTSNFDKLRAGEVVEIEPGKKVRLNLKDKTYETSKGKKVYVGNDPDFFPQNEEAVLQSREREGVQKQIGSVPGGEFLYQLGQKGIIGGIKDWGNKLIQSGDDYTRRKRAEQEISQEISEESPYTSAAATLGSFVPDIALTGGMSAAKAAPLIAGLSAGPRVLEEPGEVAGEAALGAAGGFLLDKAGGFLNRVAQRRGASRAIPAQQEAARAQNLTGEAMTAEANAAQMQKFNALTERTKNENAARLHQHNLEVEAINAKKIKAENDFKQAKANEALVNAKDKAARDAAEAETKRLNEEFKLATKQHEEALKKMPEIQREAQREYSQNVIKNSDEISRSFPKNARIIGNQVGVDEFIDNAINSTGFAGSREGAQASRILKSLFPDDEILNAQGLAKRYKAIEDAIVKSTPEVQQILNQFKTHLGERLPIILEDTIAHSKIMPSLGKQIEKDIGSIIKDIPFGKRGEDATRKLLLNSANANLKTLLREIGPQDFVNKLQSGEIGNLLKSRLLTAEDFLNSIGYADVKALQKSGVLAQIEKEFSDKHAYFTNEIGRKIDNVLARNEIKAMQAGKEASKKLGKTVKKTYGLAEEVAPPIAPMAPEPVPLPQPTPQAAITPPGEFSLPQAPNELPMPNKPTAQNFAPQPIPTLPPAQGGAERLGDVLEKKLLGGRSLVNNPLTKLAGLKFALGKAALPAEAAYLGLKGLTSPTRAGQVARLSFKQAGIQAIEALAQKYPSYHDGILENPQERRSLTKEIEDDPEIPIEQKAILQSKINRGKALQNSL